MSAVPGPAGRRRLPDVGGMRRGPRLALFAVALALAGGTGAAVGAVVPEQRTGNPSHDAPSTHTDPSTSTTVHDMDSMEDHG